MQFLKCVNEKTNCKIWVTTRLEHKIALENALSTFAYSFIPLQQDNKKNEIGSFIKKYFQTRLKFVFDIKRNRDLFEDEDSQLMRQYVENILQSQERCLGVPSQLNLMLESFTPKLKEWVDQRTQDPN